MEVAEALHPDRAAAEVRESRVHSRERSWARSYEMGTGLHQARPLSYGQKCRIGIDIESIYTDRSGTIALRSHTIDHAAMGVSRCASSSSESSRHVVSISPGSPRSSSD